jgi:hypothetical protein
VPETISKAELERREHIMRVLVENYPQAAAGNRAAWRRILAAQGREPTEEEKAAFRRSEGLPVLQVAREVEMSGMAVPPGFAEKVRKASAAFDAGLSGDLRAWQRALALTSGFVMSDDEIRRFKIVGGPPLLQIERQFALTGEGGARPQGHLDQLKKLDDMYRAGLRGAPDALRWLEAAFGHQPNSLSPKDLLGPDGSRLDFGGMADGLVAGRSGFLDGLADLPGTGAGDPATDGRVRRPGRGSGTVEDGPGDVDQQPGPSTEPGWDNFAFEELWPPASHHRGGDRTSGGGRVQDQPEPEPVWMQAADALRGPAGDDGGSGISGPRGTTDAAPPSSPDMDSFGQRDRRSGRGRGGGTAHRKGEVVEGDGLVVEQVPTVLGYAILDSDGDGQAEAHDPYTMEVVGKWTQPDDAQDDDSQDETDEKNQDSTDEEDEGDDGDGDDDAPADTDPPPADVDGDGDRDGKAEEDSMPLPDDDGVTVTIDADQIDLDRAIGGGDPVGPEGEDGPSRNATGPLIRRRNKGDVDPLPDADGVTVTIDPDQIDLDRVIGGGDPIGPHVDGGDGNGPGRPGSDDGLGPLVPDGIDPRARIDRRPR